MRVVLAGLALTLLVSAVTWAVWGRSAIMATAVAGLLATVIEVWAVGRLRRGMAGTTAAFFAGLGMGMLSRLAGVALVAIAVMRLPELFPPLPTAAGFLGVLLPLLFSEVRFTR